MFRISEKHSGYGKKQIKELKKDEKKRQKFRKKMHPISRELDNYYQPKLHDKGWFPNGLYILKKKYYYANPGLGYNYEKNNIEQLKDVIEVQKEKLQKQIKRTFIDYNYIGDNQFIITIEFCSNCKEHERFTFHHAEFYKKYAVALQKCILLRFPFISVLLKPIETDIVKYEVLPKLKEKPKEPKKYINDKFKDVRIGAFEVQLCFKHNNETKIILLHSKLESKQWPKIDNILKKIVNYMPIFNGRLIVYQRDGEDDENEQEEGEDPLPPNGQGEDFKKKISNEIYKTGIKEDLKEGLRINIYLKHNSEIIKISNELWEDVLKDRDPIKRRMLNEEKKILAMQEMKKENSISIENKKFKRNRPSSANSNRIIHTSSNIQRPTSSSKTKITFYTEDNDFINKGYNPMEDNLILDDKIGDSLKGKLLITKFTNSEGYIDIGPLPYDSYYIEVAESKEYRRVGTTLIFYSLPKNNNNYIKRYIGLYTQDNSFVQIHVFENVIINDKEEPKHIKNASVILELMRDENKEDYLEDKEMKVEMKEKMDCPGMFEQTVAPGKYLIKIRKDDFETATKICNFQKGFNSVNIEMFKERYCKLTIKVFNFEKLIQDIHYPIQSADVVMYKNNGEILEQSITDKKGEFSYIIDKQEDFVTIVINKMGYFPIQRTFIRHKDMPIDENGQYIEDMSFFLVKKNFIINERCMLFTIYSNLKKNNFSPESIEISPNLNNEKYPITCLNAQNTDGIIFIFMFCNGLETETSQNNNEMNKEGNNNQNIEQENGEEATDNINTNTNNNGNNEENENNNPEEDDSKIKENFDDILNFTLLINTDELLVPNYQDKEQKMNGLEKFGCQAIIYTSKNTFYLNPPVQAKEGYKFWNIGWVDYKNELFYQTNILLENKMDRVLFLSQWIDFLQILITKQIYQKLFQFFGFEKSALINKDRYIYEPALKKILIKLNFCEENDNDALKFICDLFRSNNNMISYFLMKRKISSNLKNFFDGVVAENTSITTGNDTNAQDN